MMPKSSAVFTGITVYINSVKREAVIIWEIKSRHKLSFILTKYI
jgi:hypothetical protein